MKHEEESLQEACVRWFRLQYPKLLIWATPNGGRRNAREAGRLKAQGVTAGVPDLFIAEPIKRGSGMTFYSPGLFVELKVGKNKLTAHQEGMLNELRARGYAGIVCYSLDDFIANVRFYLNGDYVTVARNRWQ